jgi:CheY-like chemotaxis protein
MMKKNDALIGNQKPAIRYSSGEELSESGDGRATVRPCRPRLLIVGDSPNRLNGLKSTLSKGEVDIVTVPPEGVNSACRSKHNLAVIDVGLAQLGDVLESLRTDQGHSDIHVLVDVSRIVTEPALAGMLSKYRAMPCSPSEMVRLAHHSRTSGVGRQRAKTLL